LKSYSGVCTIAFWHVPYFGPPGIGGYLGDPNNPDPPLRHPEGTSDEEYRYGLKAIWDTLYANDVHVVVNGHLHQYERWARQDPEGNADPQRGIRQFIVGTGGACPDTDPAAPGGTCQAVKPGAAGGNLEILVSPVYGVLKLTLHQNSYDWEFISVSGSIDAGTERCHSTATFQSTLADINNSLQLGLIDNQGIANSLSQKIQAAADAAARGQTEASKNILMAFKNEVSAQRSKHISDPAAQVLLEDADSLLSQNP